MISRYSVGENMNENHCYKCVMQRGQLMPARTKDKHLIKAKIDQDQKVNRMTDRWLFKDPKNVPTAM